MVGCGLQSTTNRSFCNSSKGLLDCSGHVTQIIIIVKVNKNQIKGETSKINDKIDWNPSSPSGFVRVCGALGQRSIRVAKMAERRGRRWVEERGSEPGCLGEHCNPTYFLHSK